MNVKAIAAAALVVLTAFATGKCSAYPLNDFERTGIARLEGYYYSLNTPSGESNIAPGARLAADEIYPRLSATSYGLPRADSRFSAELREALGSDASGYSVALLDISDPEKPLLAEINAERQVTPASVGKVLAAYALLAELAELYPYRVPEREKILRETLISADEFIRSDQHVVPFWKKAAGRLSFRPLREGDRANLWSYLDWMLSASSNAAASTVLKQLLLLRRFGRDYPVDQERAAAFLANTDKNSLSRLLREALTEPLRRAGFEPGRFRQGSFFTRWAKKQIPGSGSTANVRDWVKFLLQLEQGALTDFFTSRELKRLLYITQKRSRYASAPELRDAAVYFKSGSWYACREERGFSCGKFRGNVRNIMNAVAIVESPAANPRLHYIVAISSNILKKNSAEAHRRAAGRIHELVAARHKPGF